MIRQQIKTLRLFLLAVEDCNLILGAAKSVANEKDSSTFDLMVRPLSGAVTAGPLLNSDGGAKVKTS
jgi:hypothetical protein